MKIKFFGDPNMLITDFASGKPLFTFDGNGELVLSDDNPFVKRMKARFRYEVVAEQAPAPEQKPREAAPEPKHKCKKCGFGSDDWGEMVKHYRNEHPKAVK